METHSPLKLWDINDPKAKHIHLKIAEIMAPDYKPLSVVLNKGFTQLLYNRAEIQYSSSTESVLPKIKSNIDEKLAELLADVEYFSLITDIWSSSLSHELLISVTAHWINNEFRCASGVLHAQKIEGSHTGVAICQALESLLENFL